ncbi:twin-arginine translocation signal domain-containing protein [Mesorhizobium sp. NPDC059025]|uniref:twin-arginine translocation signal domain-containing protein n=1 Tax=unclassified Mesorhizobium TaxID=325217 RepID=UPI00367755B7
MSISRRLFLRTTATAGVAASIGTIADAEAAPQSPRERLEAAIKELKAAAADLWPNANDWMVRLDASPSMPLLINAYDPDWEEREA